MTYYPLVVWLPYIHNSKRGCRCRSVVVSEVELFAPVSANKYHLPFLLTHPRPLSFYQVICVTKMIFLPQRNSKSSIYSFLSPVFLHLAHTGIISKTPGLIVLNLDNTTEKTISPGVAKHTGDRNCLKAILQGHKVKQGISMPSLSSDHMRTKRSFLREGPGVSYAGAKSIGHIIQCTCFYTLHIML